MNKTIIAVILFLFSFTAKSQKSFISYNFSAVRECNQKMKAFIPNDYNYLGVDSIFKENIGLKTYQYFYGDSLRNIFSIYIEARVFGKNADLGKIGDYYITNVNVEGPYKLLFQVWKTLYDDKADFEKIGIKESTTPKTTKPEKQVANLAPTTEIVNAFYKQGKYWMIKSKLVF
jgi:hypothetical protein